MILIHQGLSYSNRSGPTGSHSTDQVDDIPAKIAQFAVAKRRPILIDLTPDKGNVVMDLRVDTTDVADELLCIMIHKCFGTRPWAKLLVAPSYAEEIADAFAIDQEAHYPGLIIARVASRRSTQRQAATRTRQILTPAI